MINVSASSRRSSLLFVGLALTLGLLLAWSAAGCSDATTTDSTTVPDSTRYDEDDGIADGTQFGWVVEMGESYLLFDVAEAFWDEEEANEAARLDGAIAEDDSLPNPFYIRNPDETPIRLVIAPAAEFVVLALDEGGTPLLQNTLTPDALARLAAGEDDGYDYYSGLYQARDDTRVPMDLMIANGQVTSGSEVYLP